MRRVVIAALILSLGGCKKGGNDLVGFEGEIEMMVQASGIARTYAGNQWSLAFKLKGDKLRMQASSGLTSVVLVDRATNKAYVVSESGNDYSESNLEKVDSKATKAVVSKTGRTDTVAGFACTMMTVNEPGTGVRTEACVVKGISLEGIGMSSVSMMTGGAGFNEVLREGLPLRVEIYKADGGLEAKVETRRIERKPVADSELRPPPGYVKRP